MHRTAATLAAVLLAGAAAAQDAGVNYIQTDFAYPEDRSYLDLPVVRASAPGIVRVLSFGSGDVLAETPVNAGANASVRMRFTLPLGHDALAVLYVDGQPVADRRIRVEDQLFFERD